MNEQQLEEIRKDLLEHEYELRDMIGKGGCGICYKVLSFRYRRVFACKVLPKKSPNDRTGEVPMLKLACHINIVNFYDHFSGEYYNYLIEEYCNNGSLDTEACKLSKLELEDYVWQLADVLAYLHSIFMVHNDIKPANCFVDANHRIKLGDFGIAQLYNSSDVESTFFSGTKAFLPPEVLHGVPHDPYKVDVWSFGVTVYNLFSGLLPFEGDTSAEIAKSAMAGLIGIPSSIPRSMRVIINICLNPDPKARPRFSEILKLKSRRPVSVARSFTAQTKTLSTIKKPKPRFCYPLRNVVTRQSHILNCISPK